MTPLLRFAYELVMLAALVAAGFTLHPLAGAAALFTVFGLLFVQLYFHRGPPPRAGPLGPAIEQVEQTLEDAPQET
jgi:hypothetical protein